MSRRLSPSSLLSSTGTSAGGGSGSAQAPPAAAAASSALSGRAGGYAVPAVTTSSGSSGSGGGATLYSLRSDGYGVGSAGLANAAAGTQVVFCVNHVLFEHAGLLLDSPSGLTIAAVMKLRQAAAGTTAITYASWLDIAVSILGLREATARSIFDVFFAFSGGCMQASAAYSGSAYNATVEARTVAELRQENNRMLLSKMATGGGGHDTTAADGVSNGGSSGSGGGAASVAIDEARWPAAAAARQVSLPGLLVFLLAQVLLERPPREALGEANPELLARSVRQNLHDYVAAIAVTRHGRVTFADALELRLLLREFIAGVEQPFGTSIGLLWPRNERTIDLAVLPQFIRPRIVLPSEVAGSAASSAAVAYNNSSNSNTTMRLAAVPFRNNLVVQGLQDTVYIAPTPLQPREVAATTTTTATATATATMTRPLLSASMTIAQCTQTTIYVAAALPHTRLSQLSNCTIVLGPVAGVLCVDRCQHCRISALCGAVVVSKCSNVTLYVCTNTPPVLCLHEGAGSLLGVCFAPYNTFYSALEDDLATTGLSPLLNLWSVGLPSPLYVLPPDEFVPVAFPCSPPTNSEVVTQSNPCVLPPAYTDALVRRVRRVQDVSSSLRDAYRRLEEGGRHDLAEGLRSKVHGLFAEWLQRSGQGKGVLDLLHHHNHPQQHGGGGGSSNNSSTSSLGGGVGGAGSVPSL